MTSTLELAETDSFVEALRSQSKSYHDQHPFHPRMNDGRLRLSRRQIPGWVANRFYYQENIPRKDAAFLANLSGPRRAATVDPPHRRPRQRDERGKRHRNLAAPG